MDINLWIIVAIAMCALLPLGLAVHMMVTLARQSRRVEELMRADFPSFFEQPEAKH